jgi:hypothetical protein
MNMVLEYHDLLDKVVRTRRHGDERKKVENGLEGPGMSNVRLNA